jgi:hypothetical protein
MNCTAAGNWCEIDCVKLVGHTSLNDVSYKELISHLKHLLIDHCLADVTFQLDNGQTISSYRNILSSRCIYFQQLFHEYPSTSSEPIRITKISYEAFYQILHFIFTDSIEPVLTYETCLELMRKADEFYLSAIYTEAFQILKKIVNKNNVLKIFTQSGLFPSSPDETEDEPIILPDVIDFCVDFIQKNRREVYLTDQMQQLNKDMLLRLVQLVQ